MGHKRPIAIPITHPATHPDLPTNCRNRCFVCNEDLDIAPSTVEHCGHSHVHDGCTRTLGRQSVVHLTGWHCDCDAFRDRVTYLHAYWYAEEQAKLSKGWFSRK